jgi:hypothetical protein
MKKLGLVMFLLILAAPLQALDPKIGKVIREGVIHPNLSASIRASRFGSSAVLLGRPLAYQSGVALYQLKKLETGEVDYVLVAVPVNPLGTPEGPQDVQRLLRLRRRLGPSAEGTGSPKATSVRCDIYLYRDDTFRNLIRVTDRDWNALKEVPYFNDEISSVVTTCTAWYLFEHTNWVGSYLYVPANTEIANLHTSYNFGDRISAIQQDLP